MSGENSFKISEVLHEVVKYLGKSELLNARLVNSEWNAVCLKQLRASSSAPTFQIKLKNTTVSQYAEFCQKTSATSLLPLRLSINLRSGFKNESKRKKIQDKKKILANFKNAVKVLTSKFGADCIQGMKIKYDDYALTTWTNLIELVKNCAAELQMLHLDYLDIEVTHLGPAAKALKEAKINFPKLTSLNCVTVFEGNSVINAVIIERSPKLLKLVDHGDFQLQCTHLPFEHLKILRMQKSLDSTSFLRKLQRRIERKLPNIALNELSCCLDEKSLNGSETKVLEYFAPSLTTFEFTWEPKDEGKNELVNLFCLPSLPQLKHLKFGQVPDAAGTSKRFIINSADSFCFTSENVPLLETVEMEVGLFFCEKTFAGSGKVLVEVENDNAQHLNVKNLILNYIADIDWSPKSQDENGSAYFDMDSDSDSLEIFNDSDSDVESLDSDDHFGIFGLFMPRRVKYPAVSISDNIQQLHDVFPNISRLVLKRQLYSMNGFKKLLCEIFNGPCFSQIAELEIAYNYEDSDCDYFHNFLRASRPWVIRKNLPRDEISTLELKLHDMSDIDQSTIYTSEKFGVSNIKYQEKRIFPPEKFTSLRVLKLKYLPEFANTKESKSQSVHTFDDSNDMFKEFLTLVAQYFVKLRTLEIPTEWIGKEKLVRQPRLEFLDQLQKQFAQLTVYLEEYACESNES